MSEKEEHVISHSAPVIATLWREGGDWTLELRIGRNVLYSQHETRDAALEYAQHYFDSFVIG